MNSTITTILAVGTVVLDILIVLGLAAMFWKRTWGRGIVAWVGKCAEVLGLVLSLAAVAGSLIYSNVLGFVPCELCWWQRVCLYPLVPIFLVSLYKKRGNAFDYALPLAVIAGVISLYHTYIQLGGTASVLPCTAVGGACTKVYVLTLGYVTIPTMSLTVALAIIVLSFIKKAYDQNRHA